MPTRRDTLIGAGSMMIAGVGYAQTSLGALEASLGGGRLGVAAIDLASGRQLRHRADARFPLCSTFKLPLAIAILAQVDAGVFPIDRAIRFTRADIVPHAPVVEPAVAAGALPVRELIRAILVESDNAAANLLLPLVGGPPGLTRFLRGQGDRVGRLDHLEPGLNTDVARSPADSGTPAAMLALTRRMLLGPVLSPGARAMVIGWMAQNRIGPTRLRAGFPGDWRAGDRTGTADGQTNDIAIGWPSGAQAPLLVACYIDAPGVSAERRDAVQAAVGRLSAALVDA